MIVSDKPVSGALIIPFLCLIALGGTWAKSASSIPRLPEWIATAPEGTDLKIESSDQYCRVEIDRVNQESNNPIRIEYKLKEKHLSSDQISFLVQSNPPRKITAEIYQRYAPWPTLSETRLIPPQETSFQVSWSINRDLLEKDAAVVFNIDPCLGTIEIRESR